jgi:muconate cycloisomerase
MLERTATGQKPTHSHANVKITRVELIPLRIPFKIEFKIAAGGVRPGVDLVVVRLHTDAGFVGIGETPAWRRQGSSETIASLMAAIGENFAPHLIGQSPFDSAKLMKTLEDEIWHSYYAQAAVADALLDLQGKILSVPAHMLLGGKTRDKLAACAIIGIKADVAKMIDNCEAFYADGFRAFTVKIGNDPLKDVMAVRKIREHFGDKVVLRVDGNSGYSYDSALSVLKKIEDCDIDAAEQMVPPWDMQGMIELAAHSCIPLMADECVASDHDLIDIIRRRVATVVQTKIAKNGGMWNNRKLWTIANAAGMRIYPGNHPGTSIVSAGVLHVAASWPGELLEGPFAVGIHGLIAEDIVTEPLKSDGPYVHLPSGPGLGLELDEDRVKHLRLDR